MNVDLSKTIGGQPLLLIRDYFRKHRPPNAETTARFFQLKKRNASALIDELCAAGLIERGPRAKRGNDYYVLTDLGRRLKETKALMRVPRAKAEAILELFKLKVAELNVRTDLIYYVDEVRAFGSYIENTPDLGDIDIAVSIKPRLAYQHNPVDASIKRAGTLGKNLSWFDSMVFGALEVKQALQQTSRLISLHEMVELEALRTRSVVIFKADRPV
jgi:DNA-binding MarR family transcriptional regulator